MNVVTEALSNRLREEDGYSWEEVIGDDIIPIKYIGRSSLLAGLEVTLTNYHITKWVVDINYKANGITLEYRDSALHPDFTLLLDKIAEVVKQEVSRTILNILLEITKMEWSEYSATTWGIKDRVSLHLLDKGWKLYLKAGKRTTTLPSVYPADSVKFKEWLRYLL